MVEMTDKPAWATEEVCDEIAEAISDSLGMVWHPFWAGPYLIPVIDLLLAEHTAADKARIAELEALVSRGRAIMENCSVTTGVCCCGDDMEKHTSPMDCGHSPVDNGTYTADQWHEEACAALGDKT
jgi:hypothetical protein